MANGIIGEITAQSQGQDWTLRLGHQALADLEDRLDQDLATILAELQARPRIASFMAVVGAALSHHHPGLDQRQIGAFLDGLEGEDLSALVTRLMEATFPALAEGEGESSEAGDPGSDPTPASA